MNSGKKINIFITSLNLFFLSMVNLANAQWVGEGTEGGLNEAGKFGLPGATLFGIIENVALWLLGIFAFFGVVGFTISGIMYLVSTGNEEMITKAKKYMLYSIIGVVVGLSGWVIIQAADALLDASFF